MPKAKPVEKPDKKLVQVRIPAEAYEAFTALCAAYGQSAASRLRMLIREELDNSYPLLRVTAAGGLTVSVQAVVTKHTEPEMTEVNLLIPKVNVTEVLRNAIMTWKNPQFELPIRTPRVYKLASSFESVDGNYHLFLKEQNRKS